VNDVSRGARTVVVIAFAVLLALPLVVGAFAGAIDWVWFGITAVLALVLIPIVWRAFRPPVAMTKAFRDAAVGVGTLVEARPTGTEINDQPELQLVFDVETADGRTIRGTTRHVVDLGSLPQFVPGATMPVRHLPDGRIALDGRVSTESMEETLYAARVKQGKLTEQQVHVARHGTRAKAVVMAMRPTGEVRDGEAVVHVEVQVTRPDGTRFDAVREMPVRPVALPGLQPGSVVDVAYLPADETYVAISTRMA
jgi:hypothetical protein